MQVHILGKPPYATHQHEPGIPPPVASRVPHAALRPTPQRRSPRWQRSRRRGPCRPHGRCWRRSPGQWEKRVVFWRGLGEPTTKSNWLQEDMYDSVWIMFIVSISKWKLEISELSTIIHLSAPFFFPNHLPPQAFPFALRLPLAPLRSLLRWRFGILIPFGFRLAALELRQLFGFQLLQALLFSDRFQHEVTCF